MGLLTHGGPPSWHPLPQEARQVAANAALYCQEQGIDLPKLAVDYTLSQKNIPITLLGMSRSVLTHICFVDFHFIKFISPPIL